MNNYFKEISEIWDEYAKRIKEPDYLIEDGIDIRKAEEYFNTDHNKVLFVLKESNEESVDKNDRKPKSIFADGGWFESYEAKRDDKKMITKMIKMYHYIQNQSVATKSQPVSAADRYRFAFININKHGNGKYTSETKKIEEALEKDAELLKRQIKALQPDVIVWGLKALEDKFKKLVYSDNEISKAKLIVTCHFSVLKYEDFEKEI